MSWNKVSRDFGRSSRSCDRKQAQRSRSPGAFLHMVSGMDNTSYTGAERNGLGGRAAVPGLH